MARSWPRRGASLPTRVSGSHLDFGAARRAEQCLTNRLVVLGTYSDVLRRNVDVAHATVER